MPNDIRLNPTLPYPGTSVNVPPQPGKDSELHDSTLVKNSLDPLISYTQKAIDLTNNGEPVDINLKAIFIAATGSNHVINYGDFNPACDINPDQSKVLAKLMAAYEEVALIRSPFYIGPLHHENIKLEPLYIDEKACYNMLEDIGIARVEINKKIIEANKKLKGDKLELICPSLKEGTLTCIGPPPSEFNIVGAGLVVEPPLNYCHCKFKDVRFLNLLLSRPSGHFDGSDVINCSFEGPFGLLNLEALKKAKNELGTYIDCEIIDGVREDVVRLDDDDTPSTIDNGDSIYDEIDPPAEDPNNDNNSQIENRQHPKGSVRDIAAQFDKSGSGSLPISMKRK